jgi:spore coat protein U-like protein
MPVASHHGWCVALFVIVVSSPAFPQVAHDVLTVQTNVRPQCRVRADDLDLGLYEPSRSSRASSSIALQCTPGVIAQIGLSGGGSGDPLNRAMNDKGPLRYQLYKDAALTQVFTDRNVSEMQRLLATGLNQRVQVYGEAPAGQTAPEGVYLDVVVVTVTY